MHESSKKRKPKPKKKRYTSKGSHPFATHLSLCRLLPQSLVELRYFDPRGPGVPLRRSLPSPRRLGDFDREMARLVPKRGIEELARFLPLRPLRLHELRKALLALGEVLGLLVADLGTQRTLLVQGVRKPTIIIIIIIIIFGQFFFFFSFF